MKKTLSIFSIAILAACSSPEQATGDIAAMSAQKDSLVSVRSELNTQITLLEEQLSKLDTTARYDAVTALSVESAVFLHYFDVFGTVEADKSISLFPSANGKVERIYVKNGQRVTQGQLLISLDTDILQSSLKELENGLALAKTMFEKQQKLWIDEQIGSEIQFLQAQNQYNGLVQRVKTLKEQIQLSEVHAPFAGTIDNIFVKEGEMAGPQSPSMRLVNTSGVYVKADVPESYANRVHVGTPANIAFTSMDYELAAEVLQVGQFIAKGNRTFTINVSLPVSDGVKPNQMVHVALQDYKNEEALTVPASLVQQDVEGNDFVYTLKIIDDAAFYEVAKTWVTTGLTYGDKTEITTGLEQGMMVIDKGSRSVRTGQRVVKG
ncbi:MAG: efflux RND transporter periplasmic adaptor subunit [Flavobacteriales bacterium]|jgi:RND family efflux transporter MFP subunit|tara:strand:+ start:569 stop:1705 length:1137 start_codon:yes stop_codon:yes gene_type:complete